MRCFTPKSRPCRSTNWVIDRCKCSAAAHLKQSKPLSD
jgi:hypothetical protein